jgi:thiamine pyrophosphokinase
MNTRKGDGAMRVAIFANGVITDLESVHRNVSASDLVICANGGTRYARALGIRPDAVIGDLDSLSLELRAELQSAGVKFLTFPASKDETDLELALLYAAEQGATQIAIFGARGGRIDHELGNLLLLIHPHLEGIDVRVLDGNQEVVRIRDEATFRGSIGDLLSLLPIGGDAHGVTTFGLKYPLCDETLCFGPARGVSNVFVGPEPTVRLRSGLLLAVHTRCPED